MKSEICSFAQGSPEWRQFRLTHFGSSEAAAMLGLSKKVTRNELLRMKKTGSAQEFSEWVQQNILDHGHAVEALARPIVERIIGDELYPVTRHIGSISASCDGLTLLNEIAFEHKQLNAALVESVDAGILPDEHVPQCQQILMVTGAGKLIFVVSDGTEENMHYMWVLPDPDYFGRLRAGWAQFEKDLAEYVPAEVVEKPVAAAVPALMQPVFQIDGMLAVIANNLPDFKIAATEFLAGIKTDLETDQDFADAEIVKKHCADTEAKIAAAKSMITGRFVDIDTAMRLLTDVSEAVRVKRLALEKTIDTKKKAIKDGILLAARNAFDAHVTTLEREIAPIRLGAKLPDFAGAMKGKRTLDTLRNAVDTLMASAKIEVDAVAQGMRTKLAWYREHAAGVEFLFADLQLLIQKPHDDFTLAVQSRINTHKAAEEQKARDELTRAELARQEQSYAAMEPPAVIADRAEAGRLQVLADTNLTDKAAAASATRITGVRVPVASYPVGAAARVAAAPMLSDEEIFDMVIEATGMTRLEVLDRLLKMDFAGMRQELATQTAIQASDAIHDAVLAA